MSERQQGSYIVPHMEEKGYGEHMRVIALTIRKARPSLRRAQDPAPS